MRFFWRITDIFLLPNCDFFHSKCQKVTIVLDKLTTSKLSDETEFTNFSQKLFNLIQNFPFLFKILQIDWTFSIYLEKFPIFSQFCKFTKHFPFFLKSFQLYSKSCNFIRKFPILLKILQTYLKFCIFIQKFLILLKILQFYSKLSNFIQNYPILFKIIQFYLNFSFLFEILHFIKFYFGECTWIAFTS